MRTFEATSAGGLLVPTSTSNDAAPADVQFNTTVLDETSVAPEDGAGDDGAEGGACCVASDHTGQAVAPLVFLATTCQ